MEFLEIIENGEITIKINGEIDLYNAPEVTDAIRDAMRKKKKIILDLENVLHADSSGLGTLMSAKRKLDLKKADYEFINIPSVIEKQLSR